MATHSMSMASQEAMGLLLIVLLGLLCLPSMVVTAPSGTPCPPVPGRGETCVCKSDKGIIDLTSLSKNDGTPRFTGLQDPNDYSYSFNPCKPYRGDYDCSNIHICQTANYDPTVTFDIADAGTERMYVDTDGTPYLYYTGPAANGDKRETKVFLHCDESVSTPQVTTEGDSQVIYNYIFDITAKEVCPGGGAAGGVAPGELGIVLILVILPLGFVSYFVIGALIMKYRYNASGTDIIPNKKFWISLPFLIKDGCMFTFGPIIGFFRAKVSQSKGYEAPSS